MKIDKYFHLYGRKDDVVFEEIPAPSAQPDIARDIATILENEQDMRVILQNAQPTQSGAVQHVESVGDCINRQAAIELLCRALHYAYSEDYAVTLALNLPSAQPETCSYWDRESNLCALHRPSAQPERHYDEWCTDCKECDQEKHCCPRWNHVIRTTLQEVQEERKTGKWIIVTDSQGRHAECPYCGEWKYHSNQKFCGECGARMEGEEE